MLERERAAEKRRGREGERRRGGGKGTERERDMKER